MIWMQQTFHINSSKVCSIWLTFTQPRKSFYNWVLAGRIFGSKLSEDDFAQYCSKTGLHYNWSTPIWTTPNWTTPNWTTPNWTTPIWTEGSIGLTKHAAFIHLWWSFNPVKEGDRELPAPSFMPMGLLPNCMGTQKKFMAIQWGT